MHRIINEFAILAFYFATWVLPKAGKQGCSNTARRFYSSGGGFWVPHFLESGPPGLTLAGGVNKLKGRPSNFTKGNL